MARRRKRQRIDKTPRQSSITSLAHDGRGVGRNDDGKVVFIDGALPGETVMYQAVRQHKKFLYAEVIDILKASDERVEPRCEVFGQCGGCALQHMDADAQIRHKQQQLLENFSKIGGVQPDELLAPITGAKWGYRRRARLGVKYVPKKGGVIVGFRERHSSFIQPTDSCHVLEPRVSALIPALRTAIGELSCRDQVPQVEVAVADNAVVLVLRHLVAFTQSDLQLLRQFAMTNDIQLMLQPGKLDSEHPLYPEEPEPLYYGFEGSDMRMQFLATDFIQVNAEINQRMVAHAIELLDVRPTDRVLDLFCGLGNFTLPLAAKAAFVAGVEGDRSLVARAEQNKQLNAAQNIEFYVGDLYEVSPNEDASPWLAQQFDKILLDPPRSGAAEMIDKLTDFNAERIVYVSCGPATLARDAGRLVKEKGFRLLKAGVIDMFPHTAHVESIAVFERK